MKKFAFLLTVTALFGMLTLTSCKPKAAAPATEATEQAAPDTTVAVEAPVEAATEVPAE